MSILRALRGALSLLVCVCVYGTVDTAHAAPAVAAGTSHTVVLTDTGTVWTWGANASGQLGLGNTNPKTIPTEVTSISGVAAITAGGDSTYVLKSDGTVWAWGKNTSGQLGDASTTQRNAPVRVGTLTNVVAIAAGASHGLALKSDGTLWAWGANGSGQIGDASTTQRTSPVQVTALGTNVVAIAAADLHSHAALSDGTVKSWGHNSSRELGDGGSTNPRTSPVSTGTLSGITRVAAGKFHGFAWDASNNVKGWGENTDGQLGDTANTDRSSPVSVSGFAGTVALAGGDDHTVAAFSGGTVWTTGANDSGQLGDGTTTARNTAAQVSGLDSVVSVAAGPGFTVAVSSDGRVWGWGANGSSQLGDGTSATRFSPVQISDAGFVWRVATPSFSPHGGASTANVTVTVTVATAGATIRYTTNGVDPTTSDTTIASGSTLTISQTTTLKALAWLSGSPTSNINQATYTLTVVMPTISPNGGSNLAVGQSVTMSTTTSGAQVRYTLDGSTPTAASTLYSSAVSITTGTTVKAIAIKSGWSDSAVRPATFSFNYGTLAAPVFTPVPGEYAYGQSISMSALAGATIRYTTDGTNVTASSTSYTTPIPLMGTTTILAKAYHPDWTTSAQSGGALVVKVSTPTLSSAGGTYAPGTPVTITDTTPGATIRYTTNGLDPTATDLSIASGGSVILGNFTLKARAFVSGWTSSDVQAATYSLSSAAASYQVTAGASHSIALKDDGTVWAWGRNALGELGDPNLSTRLVPAMVQGISGVTAIAAGDDHTVVLRSDGTVWTWGYNGNGQLATAPRATERNTPTQVSGLSTVIGVAAGSAFSLALKGDGTVWSWGNNASGQLGDGTTTQRTQPVQVSGLTGVTAIAAGSSVGFALKSNGSLWAWGANASGQVGDGTQTARTSPVATLLTTAVATPASGTTHAFAILTGGTLEGVG